MLLPITLEPFHIVWKLIKMSLLNFGIFSPILVLLNMTGNTVWPQQSTWHVVKWDFFGNFQTPWHITVLTCVSFVGWQEMHQSFSHSNLILDGCVRSIKGIWGQKILRCHAPSTDLIRWKGPNFWIFAPKVLHCMLCKAKLHLKSMQSFIPFVLIKVF